MGSRFVFLSRGWTTACLKLHGTVPVCKDPMIIESKLDETEVSKSISSLVGTTSREQVVGFIPKIMSERSTDEIS